MNNLCNGSIPGLLRRGSPVRTANSRGVCDIVTHYPNGVHCMTVFEGLTDQRCAALDLTDPTGRYHALLWLRERGHDLRWAEDEAEALAWSVLSVARGGGPIKAILGKWDNKTGFKRCRRLGFIGDDRTEVNVGEECFYGRHDYRKGWRLYREYIGTISSGSETGDLGRVAADRAALAAGYALRNPDGSLTLPELPKENA